jgi:diketogulonate reductase-like aldo/keto reductase
MISRKFGSTAFCLPIIGQGTWNLPRSGPALTEAKLALKKGIELGAVHIDTAEMYGDGKSEEIIGEVIHGLPRETLFIVSKVLPSNASFKGTIKACDASLKRLNINYLDCFLLHWRGSFPLQDTMAALEQLVFDGKIRTLGVSNFDLPDLEEASRCLSREKIACNQVLYNLGERGIERKLIPYCEQQGIAIVGYTPFGNLPERGPKEDVLRQIATKHNTTLRQVVLAFLVRLDSLFGIPKSAQVRHAIENAGAGDLKLEAQDIAAIDAAFPAPEREVPLAVG